MEAIRVIVTVVLVGINVLGAFYAALLYWKRGETIDLAAIVTSGATIIMLMTK